MKRQILAVIAFILVLSAPACAYRWPLSNSSGPYDISGTLGEYRSGHLHEGVDIPSSAGSAVYAIEGCTGPITGNVGLTDEYIKCGAYTYIHINAEDFKAGAVVQANQQIGTVKDITHDHLHLAENSGGADLPRNCLIPLKTTAHGFSRTSSSI